MKRFFTLMMAVAALLAGCKEKHEGGGDSTPAFELSQEEFHASNDGATVSVTVTSKLSWTAETAEEWISLRVEDDANEETEFESFVSSRAGEVTVEIAIVENPTADEREGVVTFMTTDMQTFTVSVSQDSAPDSLEVDEVAADEFDDATNTLHFAAAGGEATIEFTTLRNWTASVSEGAWCTVNPEAGNGGKASVTLTVSPADTTEERTTEVTLVSGEVSVTFTVEQEAMDSIELGDVKADDYDSATKTLHFTVDGGEATIDFTVTREWTASVSEGADWCTVTPAEGVGGQASIAITVGSADGRAEREAEVTLVSGDVSVTITVEQDGVDWLDFDDDNEDFDSDTNTLHFAAAGGEKSFSFTASSDWTAAVADGQDWCTVTPASGNAGNGTITVTVQQVGEEVRSTTVTITSGVASETFTVEQALPTEMELKFPDPVFREFLLTKANPAIDSDGDGIISQEEAEAVNDMTIYGSTNSAISSFQGIELFVNLEKLGLYYHNMDTLDLSKNTKLKTLYCSNNDYLKELNLSGCSELISLTCQSNSILPELDVSQTKLGNSSNYAPLYCNKNPLLVVLYLKNGWTINGIYPTKNSYYIDSQTEVEFKD